MSNNKLENAIKYNELLTLREGKELYSDNANMDLLKEYNEKVRFGICGIIIGINLNSYTESFITILSDNESDEYNDMTVALRVSNPRDNIPYSLGAALYVRVSAEATDEGLNFFNLTIKEVLAIDKSDSAYRFGSNIDLHDTDVIRRVRECVDLKEPMLLTYENIRAFDDLIPGDFEKSLESFKEYNKNVGFIITGKVLHTGFTSDIMIGRLIKLDFDFSITGNANLHFTDPESEFFDADLDGKRIKAVVTNVYSDSFYTNLTVKKILSVE